MSMINDLSKIDPKQFEAVAKELAGKLNYSDHDLLTKCAKHRETYPVYDYVCKQVDSIHWPHRRESTLVLRTSRCLDRRACILFEWQLAAAHNHRPHLTRKPRRGLRALAALGAREPTRWPLKRRNRDA